MNKLPHSTRLTQGHRERGASLIEYVLIAALVAVVAIAGLSAVGGSIKGKLESISTTIGGGTPSN